MNRENITKVRDFLAGVNPAKFNMNHWSYNPKTGAADPHTCGTVACIGGWTNAIFGTIGFNERPAGEHLGLDPDTAHDLFYPSVLGNSWSHVTPADAVKVLDHLLATGEVDWRIIR